MEIPAEFVLSHPTLCGEAIVEAWEAANAEVAEWREWHAKLYPQTDVTRIDAWWADQIICRLRELGYRRYHIGVDFAAEGTESKSAPPQMAPDAKCGECGTEFDFWNARKPCSGIGRLCGKPGCEYQNTIPSANDRFTAAHPPAETPCGICGGRGSVGGGFDAEKGVGDPGQPCECMDWPAEPAKPAETPAPDEGEALARELFALYKDVPPAIPGLDWNLAHGVREGVKAIASHVLRRERAARLDELQRHEFAYCYATDEHREIVEARIKELKGGE